MNRTVPTVPAVSSVQVVETAGTVGTAFYLYRLFNFSGTQASGTDMQSSFTVRCFDLYFLQIGPENTLRPVIGMTDIIT
jgi:hypothetical protein